MKKYFFTTVVFLLVFLPVVFCQTVSKHYTALQKQLCKGWNTWSYGSMLTHVLLPEGLAIKINFRQSFIGTPNDPSFYIGEAVVDRSGLIVPIAHSVDGSYTELLIQNWHGNTIRVQSAAKDNQLYVLVSPVIKAADIHYNVEMEVGMLWNKSGVISKDKNGIIANINGKEIFIRSTQKFLDTYHPYLSPYLVFKGDTSIGFYTGAYQNIDHIKSIINSAEKSFNTSAAKFGELQESFKAIQTVLGWNTIYDAEKERIITPVSRGWNKAWQGFVLFEWDTFFASYLFGLYNKDYAYSNAIAVTKGINHLGHIGHWQMPGGKAAEGMSQPPVGSMICWMLFEKYHDTWFLQEVYNELLTWNRWWHTNRNNNGALSWGGWKGAAPQIAAWESGMDNSPMYDNIRMKDTGNNALQNLCDVGLNSLYINDCKMLANIARVLGKENDKNELEKRGAYYQKQLGQLWDDSTHIFLNRYVDSPAFSNRLSPTLFFPMLAGAASNQQAALMVKEHYYNCKEFYSDLLLPSISFNDKDFDNHYWRGSVWPPLNFLVYLGLRSYDSVAAADLADKSYRLFNKAWLKHHAVFENINSVKGVDDKKDQVDADPFYHWGALMAIMKFMEEGKY